MTPSPSDLFLAMMILSAPYGTSEQTPPPDRFAEVGKAIIHIAIQEELIDPRNSSLNYFTHPLLFQNDIDQIRFYREELKDAPKLIDAKRLPGMFCKENMEFNRAYRTNLARRLFGEPDRSVLILKALEETDQYYAIWSNISNAQDERNSVGYRRLSMKKIKDALGEEEYNKNEVPPVVPDWAFTPLPR